MRTITGVLSATIAMASNKPFIIIPFTLLTIYLIYLEFKSDEELPE